MSTLKKTLVVGTSSVLALAGVGGGIAVAAPSLGAQQDAPEAASQTEASAYEKTDIVTLDVVEGQFAYSQSCLLYTSGSAASFPGRRAESGEGAAACAPVRSPAGTAFRAPV